MAYIIDFIRHRGVRDIQTLWTLQGEFTDKFVAGFLYGALYVTTLPEHREDYYYFKISGPKNYVILNYRDSEKNFGIPDQFDIIDIEDVTHELTVSISEPGRYTTWLRYHWEGKNMEQAVPIHGEDLDNLRGVITAANAFNVPNTDIILTKTYKDGIYYDINGLNLPEPRQ